MHSTRRIKVLFYRLHQQYHRCFYCNGDLSEPDSEITIDHVYPRSVAPTYAEAQNEEANVVAACRCCNDLKGSRQPTPEELVRLANLNSTMNMQKIADHYAQVLRLSVHLTKALKLYGLE